MTKKKPNLKKMKKMAGVICAYSHFNSASAAVSGSKSTPSTSNWTSSKRNRKFENGGKPHVSHCRRTFSLAKRNGKK